MSPKSKEYTYKVGEMVKVSNVWYHVIAAMKHPEGSNGIKIIEDLGEIQLEQIGENYGYWVNPRFVQTFKPAPDGVMYTNRGIGYKVWYMRNPTTGRESYLVINYETGEEVGDYVHATEQSAEIELREIVESYNQ